MIPWLVEHGGALAAALTAMLGAGWLVARWVSCPRRRLGWIEGLLLALPVCALLVVTPMARPLAPAGSTLAAASPAAVAMDAAPAARAPIGVRAAPASSPWQPAQVVAALYLAGASLVALRLLLGIIAIVRVVRAGARRGHSPRGHALVESARARRPFCCGLPGRGIIVLPTALSDPAAANVRAAVIAHEDAHLHQGHGRARLLTALLGPVLFWNPIFWSLARTMRRDGETCADQAASRALGRTPYVRSFLSLPALLPGSGASLPVTLGAVGSGDSLLQRMESLMTHSSTSSRPATRPQLLWRTLALASLAGLINTACGSTPRTPERANAPRTPITFEDLSLSGSSLGEAVLAGDGESTDAPFPGRIEELEGQRVRLVGYLIPTEVDDRSVTEFVVLKDNLECCFGDAPQLDHFAMCEGTLPWNEDHFGGAPMEIEGNLNLHHPKGGEYDVWLYSLRDCTARPAAR